MGGNGLLALSLTRRYGAGFWSLAFFVLTDCCPLFDDVPSEAGRMPPGGILF